MNRLAMLVLPLLLITGCSNSDKVVINTKAATSTMSPVGVGGPGGNSGGMVGGKDKKIPPK